LLAYKKKTGKSGKAKPRERVAKARHRFFCWPKAKEPRENKGQDIAPPKGGDAATIRRLGNRSLAFLFFYKSISPTASGDRPNTKQRMLCL